MATERYTLEMIERSGDLNPGQKGRLAQLVYEGSYGDATGVIHSADYNVTDKMKESGGGGSTGSYGATTTKYPQWEFDWDKADEEAFEKLRPYYTKIYDLAKGDIDLAKRKIESDYTLGLRESKEEAGIKSQERALESKRLQDEYGMGKKEADEESLIKQQQRELSKAGIQAEWGLGMEEARGAYKQAIAEQRLLFPQESESMWTGLNRRGVAGSQGGLPTGGLAGTEAGRLKESQKIRQEATDRALAEKQLRLTKGKELGLRGEEEKGEAEGLRLARALEELTLRQQRGMGGLSIQEQEAQEKLALETGKLGKSREFGLEGATQNLAATEQQMRKAHEKEAMDVAGVKMGVEATKYGAEVGEWQTEEQRAARKAAYK